MRRRRFKSLFVFKDQLEQHAPGAFNVELAPTPRSSGRAWKSRRCSAATLEAAMISPQDIAEQLPEY
ncbi:MAG: hypothetical protein R3D25_11905 [Geminicoccaceae bacterium]